VRAFEKPCASLDFDQTIGLRLSPGNGDNMSRALVDLNRFPCRLGLGCLFLALAYSAPGASLTAGEPIVLEKTHGRFDFLRLDTAKHRLLLAHTGNKSLDVFDLDSRRLLKSVPTGAAQDSAVDLKNDRYYAAVSAPPKMVIIDAAKLEVTGEVALPAAADLMAFNPASGRAYVCNDVAPELWVLDPEAKQILSTIKVSGKGMEDLSFDPEFKRLFQVVKDANALVVLDPSENKILETWSTSPATSPHGMALVPDSDFILVAGGSGKLALVNRSSGKVVANADIAPRVDQMAYDPQFHTAYCASGQGKISVVNLKADKLNTLGDVPGASGCHSIVVDPKTHLVWIAFSKGEESFVQPFTPGK
jgi:DNA-binding beta-propeller fold protein YncE